MYMKKKVYSFNSELFKVTGVQKVLMDVHHAIMGEYDAKIVGNVPYDKLHKDLGIHHDEYLKIMNPFMFRNSIVILHERKFLAFFWLLNHVFFQNIKLIYIHHSLFSDHRRMSVMPKTVVAISDNGIENLTKFFRVPMKYIHKIHNCVVDDVPKDFTRQFRKDGKIKILYPAGVGLNKRQCEIVDHLKGKLDDRIQIIFAGTGSYLPKLKEMTADDDNFKVLGFVNNVHELMRQCDYTMLFSMKEGLPITLIEATMCSMPIICNNVGGNLEIAEDGYNAMEVNSWEQLLATLNKLPTLTEHQYMDLANNSRNMYLKKFTFQIFQKGYLELLKRI